MKKVMAVGVALAFALPLVGCYSPGERAAGGAVIGGLGGAAIGAASGAIIGAATAPPRRCARRGWDYYGNRVCVAYYNY